MDVKEILTAIIIDYGEWLNCLLAVLFVGILSLGIERKRKAIWLCLVGAVIGICLGLQIAHCFAAAGM